MDNACIKWALNVFYNNGYQINSAIPMIIQDNPWSIVYRFKTDQGFVFLKKVPKLLSLEPVIINILFNEFHANVPFIIAENQEQNCFLMRDAGIQLYEYFKKNFEDNILIQVMKDYAHLQIMASDRINIFLHLGVPDWRLEKLTVLYQDLVLQENILINNGLNKDDLIKLKKLTPKLSSICEKLSHYKIKDTFGHADFHDKNILINTNNGKTTFIDLGEVVITHPFFSFLNCLHRAKENFSLSNSQYHKLQLSCFEPWLAFETQEHLFQILELIKQCWPIHAVLGEFHLINSVDPSIFQELNRKGRLAENLRYWMDQ